VLIAHKKFAGILAKIKYLTDPLRTNDIIREKLFW